MRLFSRSELGDAEREVAGRAGMSAPVLRHRAGIAVVQFCISHFKFQSVCVFCGRDRGEGLAAASAFFDRGFEVAVIVLARGPNELSEDAASFCPQPGGTPIWIGDEADFETDSVRQALNADLIVDCVAETGVYSQLSTLAKQAITAINDALATVVSVNLPSGANADSRTSIHESIADVVYAQGVITFIAPSPAHAFGELTSGPIAVHELGAQPVLTPSQTSLQACTGQEVAIAFPSRGPEAQTGEFGHVLVVAGERARAGAAGLAGLAALRTGAGLVTVACPRSVQAIVAGFAADLMTEGLPETSDGAIAFEAAEIAVRALDGKDVLVIGSGFSRGEQTVRFVQHLVANCRRPMVIDGSAISTFAVRMADLRQTQSPFRVLALHPDEAARLLGVSTAELEADRLNMARRISAETACCVVLKGWKTVTAGVSGEIWINMSGNSALARRGSGDVLAGMIGAAIARQQHVDRPAAIRTVFDEMSVAAAVHLHGLAGDIACEQLNENTVLAGDVLAQLSDAFRFCEAQRVSGLFYLQK